MTRQTSIDAYNAIKDSGLLSKRRFEVYAVLFEHGPLTGGELSELLPKKISRTIGSNVHARLSELTERGVVMEIGYRICSVSGQRVILWDVTNNLPSKIKKIKKQKCIRCGGKGFIEENRMGCF